MVCQQNHGSMLRPTFAKKGQVSSNFLLLPYWAIAETCSQWLLTEQILLVIATFLVKDEGEVIFKFMVI